MKRNDGGLRVAVVGLALVVVALAPAVLSGQSQDFVPETTCVLELSLPAGAHVTVDGNEYGLKRRLTFDDLVRGTTYHSKVRVRFAGGKEEEHIVFVQGGRRIQLVLHDPGTAQPELALQTGHTWFVGAAIFSPDDQRILTGSWDGTAILWDAGTGRQLRTYRQHRLCFNSLAFSPDGRQAISGSCDHTATLWDVATGRVLHTFTDHKDRVWAVAFSPDGRQVATVSEDKTALVWDVATRRRLRTLEGHTGAIVAVAFSPDGRELASGATDKSALLWDLTAGKVVQAFREHLEEINTVVFHPNGRQVLTGSDDRTAILWDKVSGKAVRTFKLSSPEGNRVARPHGGSRRGVTSLAFSHDGREVLAGTEDHTAIIWDTGTGELLRTFRGHSAMIWSVAYSHDSRRVLTGATDGSAVVWDSRSGQKVRELQGHAKAVSSMSFDASGGYLLTGGQDKTAAQWDVASGRRLRTLVGHREALCAVASLPDGQLLTVSEDRTTILWDRVSGQPLRTFTLDTSGVRSAQLSADGRVLVTLDGNGRAILWTAKSGQRLHAFPDLSDFYARIACVALSGDGQRLLACLINKKVVLWDANSGKKLQEFEVDSDAVTCVAMSHDGQRAFLASSQISPDVTGSLWDLPNSQRIGSLARHSDNINQAVFSKDGRRLITGAWDKTAALWDVTTGERLRVFQGHTGAVNSVMFSPDETRVITASLDGSVRLWDIASGQELVRIVNLDGGADWLVITPDGLFDGSMGGPQKVAFRIGDALNVVPVDRFFQDFYRPGLLAAIWRGERPTANVSIGKNLPPSLRVVSPKPGVSDAQQVAVEVEAADQGGGVSRLAIYQNGSRVLAPGETRQDVRSVYRTFRVTLVAGENRLRVTAASADGSWESEPAELMLRYEKPLAKSELHLLAVGINEYADGNLALHYAAKDAEGISELFNRRGKTLYQKVHLTRRTDRDATRAGILEALKQVAAQTKAQDTLVVFLAGHGTMVGQRYYFVPHEFRKQAEHLEEDIRQQGLPADEILDQLGSAPALKRILILDTCASGGALGTALKSRSGIELRGAVERLARTSGVYMIAASAATEQAQESKQLGHGVLSYALLAGLKGVKGGPLEGRSVQPSRPDRVVDVMEWITFAAGEVPRLTEKLYGVSQDVQYSIQGQSFPLLPLDE